jgi:LMBR1 domain-containing protein 1
VLGKIAKVFRPFEFVIGIVLLLLSLLIFVCLLMSSADKLMQMRNQKDAAGDQIPPDYMRGYTKVAPRIINPFDLTFTKAATVFPIDYILVVVLVYYLVLATISGVKKMGVRFCHLQMYKIRPRRTVPQGLLFLAFIIVFVILAMNVLLLTLAPRYVTYGHQHYATLPSGSSSQYSEDKTGFHLTCIGLAKYPYGASKMDGVPGVSLDACSADAPAAQVVLSYTDDKNGTTGDTVKFLLDAQFLQDPDETVALDTAGNCTDDWVQRLTGKSQLGGTPVCGLDGPYKDKTMGDFYNKLMSPAHATKVQCKVIREPCSQTRVAALLHTFFYKFWFFSAIYYWAIWAFLVLFFLAFVYYTCCGRRSLVQQMVKDVKDDFDDSDDDMTPFRGFGNRRNRDRDER